ncbi:SDR family NAD(P)-dependent oxidoreductase, partial [Pseudonocardia pini]|uniref:SDR family NAD(P)-dependent oxidoreductase n=1 Tax=Pseudonocardia pini TaxID=2758030 RepID=UPI0015EFFF3F
RGAAVVVVEIEAARGEQTAAMIHERGGQALVVPTDVMDTAQVAAAVAAAEERFGRVDILVNNAGGVRKRRFLDQSERSWRRHIDINLTSVLAATWHAAHAMVRGGRGGSIVNVASIEASRAAPTFAVYAACKAGMVNFTRSMAVELGEHGIRVNAIAPDLTRTAGNSGVRTGPVDPAAMRQRGPREQAGLEGYIPLGREGHVDECGDVVAFLCSPMARYVSGVTIPVDGGTWASSGWVRAPQAEADKGWVLFEAMGG